MSDPISITGERVRLRPIEAPDAPALRRIREQPEVARWWDELEPDFPFDVDEDLTRLTILAGHGVVGMVQYSEESDPKYRSASVDIFLDATQHGRGLGAEALELVVAHLIDDRGHHRLVIDPAADNLAAIRCYEKVGFTPIGRTRRSERDATGDGWHDQLLMELVVD